jgi:uncharacterized membrane protein YidH (DUF202 family)
VSRPGPDEVTDEGLQQERTALAWNRTALAMIIAGALYLRVGGPPLLLVPGVLMIAFGGLLLVTAGGRYRRLRQTGFDANRRLYLLVAGSTLLFSIASGVSVLVRSTVDGLMP